MNRRMCAIYSLIDELSKSEDKMSGNDMSEMASLCCNATITILELQNDVELLRKMWHQTRLEAQSFKAENDRLREDLEFERSENGWAREFLNRMGQKCGTKDCPSLVAYVTKLEAENAKLRELVRDMWLQLLNAYDRKEVDEFADRMRELGVEVE